MQETEQQRVFADFLGLTFPVELWPELRAELVPVLDAIGAAVEQDDAGRVLWRVGDGTVKAQRYGPVMALGASGAVLAGLRGLGLLGVYLSIFGGRPHQVTRLDVSMDVPAPTAPVIASIVRKAHSKRGLSLTRKRVDPRHVTRLVVRGDDGKDTGTVYVGSRSAETRLCVYDKRQERIARGLPDVGPLTRYEVRLKAQVGMELRDVAEPAPLFWRFIAPDVLPAPVGVLKWEPSAEGFAVEKSDALLPGERLRRRVQASPDAHALALLAVEVGPYGFDLLLSELRKLVGRGEGASPLR